MGGIAHGPRNTRAVRGAGKWALSLLTLAVVLVVEFAFLHDRISADVSQLLAGGTSAPRATVPAPVVPVPAPAAAGDVGGVDLRTVSGCTPGVACTVRLHVDLHPGTTPVRLDWSYRITDLCSGATTTVPGGSVAVPPRGERADLVGTVPLPRGPALAVVAVVTSPATAAALALTVPPGATCAPPTAPRPA